ncbi:alpha/beta hydrolase [Nonomuraea sp. NPDC050556]|uniref:alpha/beta hydrolase n=1 Tax=Nonomuraea sp. NPDC050556 TaxID=3364369 RepID=UPI0037AF7C33
MRTTTSLVIAAALLSGCAPAAPAAAPKASAVPTPFCVEAGEGRYADGVLILGKGDRGIVAGAQANGGVCQMLPFAREMAAKGYRVAVFDWKQPYDQAMAAATRALVADGAGKVVLGGFSRGALVGLGVAPTLGKEVVGVFSVSGGPSPSEGFATIESVSGFDGPILLISSEEDRVFPAGTNRRIAAAHNGPETVLMLPGSLHALSLLDGPDKARVRKALDDFLTSVLR